MTLTAKIPITFNITFEKTSTLSVLTDVISSSGGENFTDGTGANKAQILYQAARTLTLSANETISFQDGSLTDNFGDAVTIEKLKAIYIKNKSTDADLQIGGAAATQMGLFVDTSDKLNLPPGGTFLYIAPDANGVDISVNDSLKFEHDGGGSSSLTYDIIVIGED